MGNINLRYFMKVVIGAVINAVFLWASAFAYNLYLIKWPQVFGSGWFFILETLLIPLLFLIKGQKKMAVGAILGILLYFITMFAVMAFLGMH